VPTRCARPRAPDRLSRAPVPTGRDGSAGPPRDGRVTVARVAVEVAPAHLDRPFDYLVPDGRTAVVGQRVRVRFAGRMRPGWVVEVAAEPAAGAGRLLPLVAVEGPAWFDAADLALYRWVADRWAGTLAGVLRHAVPHRVASVEDEALGWGPPPAHRPAPRPPCPTTAWRPYGASALLREVAGAAVGGAWWLRPLPDDDRAGLVADLVARCLASGRSALVLAADPRSPLAVAALAVAGPDGADLRGDAAPAQSQGHRPDRARYRAALRCRLGHARVAVGGRGAVLTPVRDLGLVVVDDEANPAYKERRAPRHHARDVALARARLAGATAVLLGDLPSAALWRLLDDGHVRAVTADRFTERAHAPRVDVVDLGAPRPGARRTRISSLAGRALSAAVRDGGAAVVLAARGGEGTALACRRCGRRRACPVCDGAVRVAPAHGVDVPPEPPARNLHTPEAGTTGEAREPDPGVAGVGGEAWRCATCGWEGPGFVCPGCGAEEHAPLAAGAGRLATELARSHPGAEVVRMEGFDAPGPTRRPGVAVLTRGSVVDRPVWLGGAVADVVVVPDADALLGRPAFDAGEDALRLWLAAGHWTRHLIVQTREPDHPAVAALVRWDPEGFWRRETERRAELGWPPHRWLVRLTAPPATVTEVARAVREALTAGEEVLGPDPDGAIVVTSPALRGTLAALEPLRRAWGRDDTGVRIDVDPVHA